MTIATNLENIKEILSMDPYNIKKSLINLTDKYFKRNNVDLYEAGFLGYLTQINTLLTSDVLFNSAMSWNEAFTHLLKLPTSLQNHANMFDYKLPVAQPCEGSIMLWVPFPQDSSQTYKLTLRNGTSCDGTIPYLVKDTYIIDVPSSGNSPKVQRRDSITGIISSVDNITIEQTDNGDPCLVFPINVWQISIASKMEQFVNVVYKEFYDMNVQFGEDYFYDINIGCYIQDDNIVDPRLVRFNRVQSIYSCGSKDKVYTFKYYGDGRGLIRFGNGIFGYQPKEESYAQILVYTTKGNDGKAYPGQIQLNTSLTDYYTGVAVTIFGSNTVTIDNGVNEDDIEVSKNNIIAQTSSARRLVTEADYLNFMKITNINNVEIFPMLLRRDNNANEIDLFSVLYDESGQPIPTTNLNYVIDKDRKVLSNDTVYKLALVKGENGVELVPNVLKIINPNAVDSTKHEVYSAIYVNNEFDNFDTMYGQFKGVIYKYSDNSQLTFEETDLGFENSNITTKEFICPFNINIDTVGKDKTGTFEYIPYSLNDQPTVEDSTGYDDIEFVLNTIQFSYDPETALEYNNVLPDNIIATNTMTITSGMEPTLIKSYVRLRQAQYREGTDGSLLLVYDMDTGEQKYNDPSVRIECSIKSSTIDNTVITTCKIPLSSIPFGKVLYEYEIYYSDKFYNIYKKTLQFVDITNSNLDSTYVGIPISMAYNPVDPTSEKQDEPLIDRIYMTVSNVNVQWSNWLDKDNLKVDGYEIKVDLNVIDSIDDSRIKCEFSIGYGDMRFDEPVSVSRFSNTSIQYLFRVPYDPDYILNGSTYYKVVLGYKFKDISGNLSQSFSNFATYSGYLIFKRKFSELMWCNIERLPNYTNDVYKIYRIPVIDKEYYENHREYIENKIFYQLTQLDINTINYKMLTNKLNFKFAKTIGATENLKYNDNLANIDANLIYNGWTCDLPPTIRLRVLISRDTETSKQDIINECKTVVLSFLSLKAGFNVNIIRSEIVRYIHDVMPNIISCEVVEPSKDIIYLYREDELPRDKDTILSYNPEYIWIDIDKIKIDVVTAPA